MFVIKINDVDSSAHTLSGDADAQKARFIANGIAEEDIEIVEQDSFNPPQE